MEPKYRNGAMNRKRAEDKDPRRPHPTRPAASSKSSNVVTSQDYEELKQHYKFVLPSTKEDKKSGANNKNSTWQDRMVEKYHAHLYKEFAIVDLSVPGRIGLRFRTKPEVVSGKGFRTCGNKGCPSLQQSAAAAAAAAAILSPDRKMAHEGSEESESREVAGAGLCDYEVPFQYVEQNEKKMELVKLRLCKLCAPLLMERSAGSAGKTGKRSTKGGERGEEKAAKREKGDNHSTSSDSSSGGGGGISGNSTSSDDDSSSSSHDGSRQRHKKRRGRRHRKKKRQHMDAKSSERNSHAESGEKKTSSSTNEDSSTRSDRHRRHRRRKDRHRRDRKHKRHKSDDI